MTPLVIPNFRNFKGSIKLPGSKSIANRALLFSALNKGTTCITGLPLADDIKVLLAALPQLGVTLSEQKQDTEIQCEIVSPGAPFTLPNTTLQLENAGTALRPLTALLCAGSGNFTLTGNTRMQQRPIQDLCKALNTLGATIQCATNGCPPVHIQAKGLAGGKVYLSPRTSSQFVSALLMAAPLCQNELSIHLEGTD